MGFSQLNASGLSRHPTVSLTNLIQPSDLTTRAFTVRAQTFNVKDQLRVEAADGTRGFRVGYGGLGGIAEEPGGGATGVSLTVAGTDSAGSQAAGGYIGSRDVNGTNEIYMQSVTSTSVGAGPHLQMITGIGRPATEYWYTEIVHKHNYLHVAAQGIESYSSTAKHFFTNVFPTDDGAGNVTFIYQSVIDWQTGRTVFNPAPSFPQIFTATVDVRGEPGAIPVLRVTPKSGATGDLQVWSNTLLGVESRVNKNGYFMTRRTSAPADADLANSEGALWIDATTGNLKWKSKTSGGTVVTRTLTTA